MLLHDLQALQEMQARDTSRKELNNMLEFMIKLIFFPIIMMIWLLKLVFWVPVVILGLIFDDGGPGPGRW